MTTPSKQHKDFVKHLAETLQTLIDSGTVQVPGEMIAMSATMMGGAAVEVEEGVTKPIYRVELSFIYAPDIEPPKDNHFEPSAEALKVSGVASIVDDVLAKVLKV